jgi:hypothetical protein
MMSDGTARPFDYGAVLDLNLKNALVVDGGWTAS